jgi:hypothetical protein
MGTTASIHVQGFPNVCFYKHFDGSPKATLPWLTKFNQDFTNDRGDDPNYKFAQLIRSSARDASTFNLDDSNSTGWGVFMTNSLGTCEYEYTLMRDGTVQVNEPKRW